MTSSTDHDPVPQASVSLREAAAYLDVHYMTAYRYVRTGRLTAQRINGNWRIAHCDLESLRDEPAPHQRERGTSQPRTAQMLVHRLLRGDEPGGFAVVENALASWATPTDVHLELLSPALRTIGDKWASGEITVAQEHRASAVALRIIGRLGPQFLRPGRRRGSVIVGAQCGDPHAIPVAMVADLLRQAGFEVVDLGADVPPDGFAETAADADRLVAVAIGSTTGGATDALRTTVAAVRQRVPGVAVIVGGAGTEDAGTAEQSGADACSGCSGPALVDMVSDLERPADQTG